MSMKANELKVKDLMIGDWILFKGTPAKISGIQIWGEPCAQTNLHDMWFVIGFEPIPLTLEILKKNGFVQDANYSFRFFSPKVYKTRDIGVDFTIKGFTFWYGDTISIACGDGSRINRLPCCVHHLQHALKLCGIDKEIVV